MLLLEIRTPLFFDPAEIWMLTRRLVAQFKFSRCGTKGLTFFALHNINSAKSKQPIRQLKK